MPRTQTPRKEEKKKRERVKKKERKTLVTARIVTFLMMRWAVGCGVCGHLTRLPAPRAHQLLLNGFRWAGMVSVCTTQKVQKRLLVTPLMESVADWTKRLVEVFFLKKKRKKKK